MRRGQSAVEFTLITTAMLVLFSVAFIVVEQRFLDVQEARLDGLANDVLDKLEAEVQIAWEAGNGYQRSFFIPRTLSGVPYDLVFNDNQTIAGQDELVIRTQTKEYLRFIPFDMTGSIQKGQMNISGGTPVTLTPS